MLKSLNLGNSISNTPTCREQCLVTSTRSALAKSPCLNDNLWKEVLQSPTQGGGRAWLAFLLGGWQGLTGFVQDEEAEAQVPEGKQTKQPLDH